MTTKTVLAFSGGWDSTFLLWKLLADTDDEITAIYIDSQFVKKPTFTNKSYVQYERAKKIIDELQKIRSFTFKKYVVKPEDVSDEIHYKTLLFIQHVAPLINNGTYDRITHGSSYEDLHRRTVAHLEYAPIYYAMERLFNKLCTRGKYFIPLIDNTWFEKYNRAYAISMLPVNIRSVIASCLEPKFQVLTDEFNNCDECVNCLVNRKVKELLDSGLTPEEIQSWRESKSVEYGNGSVVLSMTKWISTEMEIPGSLSKEELQQDGANIYLNQKISGFSDPESAKQGIWKGLFYPNA